MQVQAEGLSPGKIYASIRHMKRTTVFVDPQLERELQALARREGRPMAALVREAVAQYIAAARPKAGSGPGFMAVGRSGRADVAERHEELLFAERPVSASQATPQACAKAAALMAVLVDTGILYALADADDRWHEPARRWLAATSDLVIVRVTALPEVAYLLQHAARASSGARVRPEHRRRRARRRGTASVGPGPLRRRHAQVSGNWLRRRVDRGDGRAPQDRVDRHHRSSPLHRNPPQARQSVRTAATPSFRLKAGAWVCVR